MELLDVTLVTGGLSVISVFELGVGEDNYQTFVNVTVRVLTIEFLVDNYNNCKRSV